MCGRFSFAVPELLRAFGVSVPDEDIAPRYNIAPGQSILLIVPRDTGCRLERAKWERD